MKIKYFQSFITRTKYSDKHWSTYLFFVALRFVLVFLPQLGYVHPDEFFQSTEIFLGDQFELEHTRAWEFNNTFPLRSVTLPYFMFKVPLSILDMCSAYVKHYIGLDIKTSYTYLVFPRLIMCSLSLVNDWSIYKICGIYSLRHEIRLLTLASSYVTLVFCTRTFSNSVEMAIASFMLYIVAECMIHSNTVIYKKEFLDDRYEQANSTGEKVKIWKLKNALPAHNYNKLLAMSTLSVAGVFNRPTFLLFGAPMVFYWMLRGMGTKTVTFANFNIRMLTFCLSAVPSLVFFIIGDSFYYKHLTLGEIHMLDLSLNNFVVTPWNFIKYNIDSNKTAEHGLHPRYLHLLVNIPMLYNILGIAAICSFGFMLYRFYNAEYRYLPRSQSIVGLMTSAIFAPLFFLSLINHQEPRFLIPFTLPIVLMHSPKLITGFCTAYPFKEENRCLRFVYDKFLCSAASAKHLLKIWYTINIAMTIFFGFLHQGGVYPLAQHFEGVVQAKPNNMHIHLATSHIYNMPLSFINTPSSSKVYINRQSGQRYSLSKEFFLHEYGGLEVEQLVRKLKLILDVCEMKAQNSKYKYSIYLAIPNSLGEDLQTAHHHLQYSMFTFELVKMFYPHVSTEALPKLHSRHLCDLHAEEDDLTSTCDLEDKDFLSVAYSLKQFSSFVHQFGLALYKIELQRRRKTP